MGDGIGAQNADWPLFGCRIVCWRVYWVGLQVRRGMDI